MSKIYTSSGKLFKEISSLPIDQSGLIDMKTRIKLQPHFLGEPLIVIAEDFDFSFLSTNNSHVLIALDSQARLTVIVLSLGTADIQNQLTGLEFCSTLSSFSPDYLSNIAFNFSHRPQNEQIKHLWENLNYELSSESVELTSLLASAFEKDIDDFSSGINSSQRVILAAEDFSPDLLKFLHWLNHNKISSTALRYRKYLVANQEVFFAEQVSDFSLPILSSSKSSSVVFYDKHYHLSKLDSSTSNLLEELLTLSSPSVLSSNWNNKYYFSLQGSRRSLRIRTYHKDFLEVGFYNSAPAAVSEFITPYNLVTSNIVSIGGYFNSPFLLIDTSTTFDFHWECLFKDWLSGASPGKSLRK